MTISAVNYTGACESLTTQAENPISPIKSDENPIIAQANGETSEIMDTVEISDSQTSANSVKAKGVLRLLQQGHFKGVADIRLRINFADEINALESEKAAEVAQNGLTDLADMINAKIEEALQADGHGVDTLAGITEAQDVFNAALTSIADDVANSSGSGAMIDRLGSEFDQLAGSLGSVFNLTETPEEQVGEEIAVPEGSPEVFPAELSENKVFISDDASEVIPIELPESEFDAAQFMESLITAFASELQKLETELAEISVLPPLSEPRGNGSAYQKFLTMYNDMHQIGNTAAPSVIDNMV